MRTSRRQGARFLIGLAVLVLAIPAFSGCLGLGKEKKVLANEDPLFIDPVTVEPPENVDENDTTNLFVPKAHYHHYWGEPAVPRVTVFDGDVELRQLPLDKWRDDQNWPVGYAEFNLESDGDDVSSGEGDNPINPTNGHADAVFAGTSHLIVNVSWKSDEFSGGLRFKYQPGCSPTPLPLEGPGFSVELGEELDDQGRTKARPIRVPVRPGCADPPHQISVSRWSFLLLAAKDDPNDPLASVGVSAPALAQGTVRVLIEAQNGGEKYIDPPHPDLFEGSDTLKLGGPVSGTFRLRGAGQTPQVKTPDGEEVLVQQCQYLAQTGARDVRLPTRFIVPFQSKEVAIHVELSYASADGLPEAQAAQVVLLYHPSNDTKYRPAPGGPGSGEYRVTIEHPKQASMTDPVYNVDSDWRFGFDVVTEGQRCVGYWEGSYTLTFTAVRDPGIRIF